jgi:predicted enzyme related to lactoylglutathione lyase
MPTPAQLKGMSPFWSGYIFVADVDAACAKITKLGGMMNLQAMLPSPMWLYYFNVDGMDVAVTRITSAGGKIAMGPHQVPGGNWIVSAFDPHGGLFQLTSTTQ